MKDFNDFVKTLTKLEIEEIYAKVNGLNLTVPLIASEDSAVRFMSVFGTVNIAITVEILRRYHSWLDSEELPPNLPH